ERGDHVLDERELIAGEALLLLAPEVPCERIGVTGDVRLVRDAKRHFARAAARPRRRAHFSPRVAAYSLAMVSAASATCAPVLPWVPPLRASACAASCTASTPFSTGTPVSSATRCSPCVAPSATRRKCSVSPRITTPNASTASKRPESAAHDAATGSSWLPGTQVSSTWSAG